MDLHFGYEETILFEFWVTTSVYGFFIALVIVGLFSFLAEGTNHVMLYLEGLVENQISSSGPDLSAVDSDRPQATSMERNTSFITNQTGTAPTLASQLFEIFGNRLPETETAERHAANVRFQYRPWRSPNHEYNILMPDRSDFKPPETIFDDQAINSGYELRTFRSSASSGPQLSPEHVESVAETQMNTDEPHPQMSQMPTDANECQDQPSVIHENTSTAAPDIPCKKQDKVSSHYYATFVYAVMIATDTLLILLLGTYNVWLLLVIILGRSMGYFIFNHP